MLPVNILTKRFEQQVARDLWDDARTSFNQPTRRMKERKTHIEVPGVNGRGRKSLIPAGEYPAGFVFYKMGRCRRERSGDMRLLAARDGGNSAA